ncbi:MAG: ZIP family metal transporter [Xanthomarina sp.]
MNKYLLPVFAVILGALIVLFVKKKRSLFTRLLLSFSGAFLLALTLFDLLPEVYNHVEAKQAGLFIMFGILLQIVLEFFSKGAEHGHIHIQEDNTHFPWLLFISLCIHSFLEGFPIHQHNDMVYGVLIHKIPIATLITSFLVQSKYSKKEIAGFLIFFAAMTPLGTFVSNSAALSDDYIYLINAIVIGIFFHISTVILFESSEGHKFNLSKLLAIFFGLVIAYII